MAGYIGRSGNHSVDRTGASVSRKLRSAGLNVVAKHPSRIVQGLTVSNFGEGRAKVRIDYGDTYLNDKVRDEVVRCLMEWDRVAPQGIHTPGSILGVRCVYVTLKTRHNS